MAIRFLNPGLAWVARLSLLRGLAARLYQQWLPGAYLYTISRTKHIDAVLRRELEMGTGQVAILGAVEAIRLVRKRKKPFLFGIAAGGLDAFLGERGLELVEELEPAEVERTYLTRSDGSLIGRSVGYWALAHAWRPD